FRHAAVGEVTAQQQEVGLFVDLTHELAETAVVVSAAVQVSCRCDSYFRARVARHSSYLLVPSRPTRVRLGSPTLDCRPDNSRSRQDFLGRSGPANRRAPTSLSPSISARTAPNSAPRFALRDKRNDRAADERRAPPSSARSGASVAPSPTVCRLAESSAPHPRRRTAPARKRKPWTRSALRRARSAPVGRTPGLSSRAQTSHRRRPRR